MRPSSKFYPKSLTLLLPILKMVDSGKTSSEIAESLRINKSHVFYYLHKAQNMGYIKENGRDSFKRFEMTQAGKTTTYRIHLSHLKGMLSDVYTAQLVKSSYHPYGQVSFMMRRQGILD
jgi:predicted transcriptional regulator